MHAYVPLLAMPINPDHNQTFNLLNPSELQPLYCPARSPLIGLQWHLLHALSHTLSMAPQMRTAWFSSDPIRTQSPSMWEKHYPKYMCFRIPCLHCCICLRRKHMQHVQNPELCSWLMLLDILRMAPIR